MFQNPENEDDEEKVELLRMTLQKLLSEKGFKEQCM